ncbi:MAG: PorV/PorQ family protein [Candidatus Marinimicrobia bacterium]|nr:PorV/PorQ family protein [Candidatus Neomarinimicrobiota bacterium]
MKSKKYLTIIILLTIAFVNTSIAQFDNVGTSVANFLKIGVGARGIAMGSACVADVNDGSVLYWNVAGLAALNRREVFFSNTNWLMDISHNFLAVAFPIDGVNAIGLSINSINMGEMEETTEYEPDGTGITFSGGDIGVGIAYARAMTDRFSVGIQGKYIRETVAFCSADAVAIDIGTLYITQFHGLKIGMAISNFGTKMRLRGREQLVDIDIDPNLHSNPEDITARLDTKDWPLPLSFRIGVSVDLLNTSLLRYTHTVDYYDVRDLGPIYCTGAEIALPPFIMLRAGIQRRYFDWDTEKDLPVYKYYPSIGAGIRWKIPKTNFAFKVDFAYVDYMNAFDPILRYSGALEF